MKYTYRKTAFTKTETFEFEDTQIKVFNENLLLIDTINYNEIKSIAMVRTPTKLTSNLHQCSIKTNSSKEIVLRNYSYIGIANFKNQNEDYLKIISVLHNKVANKNIKFKKGVNKVGFMAMLIFLVLMAVLMGVVTYVLYDKNKVSEMITSIIGTLATLFLVFLYIQYFKPANYDPTNIPKIALPRNT